MTSPGSRHRPPVAGRRGGQLALGFVGWRAGGASAGRLRSVGGRMGQRRIAVAGLRRRYARGTLTEGDLAPDPVAQFSGWLADAVAAGLPEPNAMVLACLLYTSPSPRDG